MFDYRAKLDRVVDGDTVKLLIDHGMSIHSTQSIRLVDVWAPELSQPGGKEARSFVEDWFALHLEHTDDDEWPWMVITFKDKRSFNRYVGLLACRGCANHLNSDVNIYLGG